MSATVTATQQTGNSAKVGPVARAMSLALGMTEGGAHQFLQRIRKVMPVIVRTAVHVNRAEWVDWFFADADIERAKIPGTKVTPSLTRFVAATSGAEECSRIDYCLAPNIETAREWDHQLERECTANQRARSALRNQYPQLVAR